jgi:hypothetical protein
MSELVIDQRYFRKASQRFGLEMEQSSIRQIFSTSSAGRFKKPLGGLKHS